MLPAPSLKPSGLTGHERGWTRQAIITHALRLLKLYYVQIMGKNQSKPCVIMHTFPWTCSGGPQMPKAGVRSSTGKWKFRQKGFQHGSESLHMSCIYAKCLTVKFEMCKIIVQSNWIQWAAVSQDAHENKHAAPNTGVCCPHTYSTILFFTIEAIEEQRKQSSEQSLSVHSHTAHSRWKPALCFTIIKAVHSQRPVHGVQKFPMTEEPW